MIEVNLLPGGKKRSARRARGGSRGRPFGLPALGGPLRDRWILAAVVAWVVVLGVVGWAYLSINGAREEVEVAVAAQVQDSARFADIIAQVEGLLARRDSIIQRVEIIQGIDQDRYIWPHVLDEVARALPDYTWLTSMVQASPPPNLQVRITGQAGNNFAVAEFITRLSESSFIRVANLISSSQTVQDMGGPNQQVVYDFSLDVIFQPPPPEVLEMVPLFADEAPPTPAPGA
ncbi:MAG: PilN domain-containing protein [Longimicrobiales bacterium]|nr:PilN domain-containing protein [Longimicrobiales bacterium]